MDLRVDVLGPLEVERDGQPMRIPGRKERALLATLAVRAGWVLTVDQLIDVLWNEEPPPSAHATLRSYISRLRRVLGEAIVSGPGGYALDLDGDAVDA
ncbi:MAG: winged helix-turn-helix domain-containing protein, partial [Acidimicrobiia bacterium]|nr:winged helix-turn-helix domain-containing protein [Acidimicrobiia bacterium]